MTPRIDRNADSAREFIEDSKRSGKRIAVVMTMGALHDGHLSLVKAANEACDVTVVTIFVNPTQFGPTEDLDKYPRQLEADIQSLCSLSVDLVFAPSTSQMYGPNHSTSVRPPAVASPYEGQCRPGHFEGVTTVVLKLLHIIPADMAFFGSKDFQQLQVIRAMVEDLDLGTTVVGCPIVRETDGLALSSRNAFMSDIERVQALGLSQGLSAAAELFAQGEHESVKLASEIRRHLSLVGISKIDYVAVVDPVSLVERPVAADDSVALIAAYVGNTRLIDNRRLGDGPIVTS